MIKPMLAAALSDFSVLKYPCSVSPKLDGIRCLVIGGKVLSRSLKPIPNKFIQEQLKDLPDLDGELIIGSPTDPNCFRNTTSGVMSEDGEPDFKYYVFDSLDNPSDTFRNRFLKASKVRNRFVESVPHIMVGEESTLHDLIDTFLNQGYEGAMVRSLDGAYKYGRATSKEGTLFKYKAIVSEEAIVVGFEEQMANTNTATVNALGRTERSSHKEGKKPKDTLGKLIVRDLQTDIEFEIGTGFTDIERKDIWTNQDTYLNKIVSYTRDSKGNYSKPRFPVFKGFRNEMDMS